MTRSLGEEEREWFDKICELRQLLSEGRLTAAREADLEATQLIQNMETMVDAKLLAGEVVSKFKESTYTGKILSDEDVERSLAWAKANTSRTSGVSNDGSVDLEKALDNWSKPVPEGVDQHVMNLVQLARTGFAKEGIPDVEEEAGLADDEERAWIGAAWAAMSATVHKYLQNEQAVREKARTPVRFAGSASFMQALFASTTPACISYVTLSLRGRAYQLCAGILSAR
eukprot:1817134-Rhodomonas_salina.1